MVFICIILSIIVGFVLGHFIWTNTKEVVKEVIKEKEVEVEVTPVDYDEYLSWKKNKQDWINLKNIIPDDTIEDDVKFEKIMKLIEKELKTTDNGEFTPPKHRKRKH